MPTRRIFLQTSLAGLTVQAWPGFAAATTIARPPLRMVESVCPDTRAFAACGADIIALAADPAALRPRLYGGDHTTWFGFTRAAQFFVLAELARDHGYRVSYRGVHEYRAGQLAHSLQGDEVVVAETANALFAAGAAWPQALAASASMIGTSRDIGATRTVMTAVTAPSASPAHLVSWALGRA